MPANRMSRLPIAEFCGRSGELDVGSGRAAAMSTAFHAMCEGDPAKIAPALARLTQKEVDEIKNWERPVLVHFDDGTELSYDSAEKESRVGIDARGRFELDAEKALVVGTLDMAWTVEKERGCAQRICYVGDIKKTKWTTLDGPESLQLAGYGFALSAREQATHFCPGLWIAEDGEWVWGDLIDLESSRASDLWARIEHAATNQGGEFRTGGHCSSCWARLRCPAYLLPYERHDSLAVLSGADLTNDKVLELLVATQQAEATIKVAKEFCNEYARRHGIDDPSTGKSYRAVQCQGRESAKVADVLEAFPEARQLGVVRRGAHYEMMRWVKKP
jgi:hypothetical protein